MPTISSNKKATELESNDKLKRVLVRKKQRNQRRREKKKVRKKFLLETSGTKSKNLEKITNDGEKKTVEVEKQSLDEAAEQKVKNAEEQNMKGQTIKSKQDETENKHIDKENEAVKQSKEEKTHTLKQMEFAIEPKANKEMIHVPCKQNKKITEREKSSEKEKQVETNNMMNITEKSLEKKKQTATGTVLNITKMSSEKEVKQTATEDKLRITRKKSPENRQQATMATDNTLNTNITILKSSEKEKQMETDDTMMINDVKCTTKEANKTDQSKLHTSESVQTVVIGTESAKLKKATSEEVPSNKQPEKETRKAPLKEDTLVFKAKEKSSNPINPTTSEYVDINLKNMTHIYICDGRQVCNAFNMSTFTGIGCPGTCNQLHLSLPIYNPHSKINMSIPQMEELADVLKDTKGNVCFFNLSQKMICNNFNSEEGCMNKNCFMIHTSFYEIFNAYFIKKLNVRKTPRYVKRQSSLTEQCKTKPPFESTRDLKCKVRQHPKERVSEPHDHVKDTDVQVKDVQKVCKLNVKENCTNEKETSNNKSSLEKLQKAQPIKDQQRRGQNKISGTSSKQLTPNDRSGKNQEDTSYEEQGKTSFSMANKPEETIEIDRSERIKTNQPENNDDLVTVINVKSPWRICRFFNTARGCRRWKCPYQHVQNQPLRSVKSNMKSNLKNSTSYESPSTKKRRITQEDFPASTEKHSHPAAKKMKTKLSEISKGSEKQTKEKICGKIIRQKVKQETSAFPNTEKPVMKINANAETNKACEVKNPITETVNKPQSNASKSSESNAIKEPNSGLRELATSLKDNNGNNNQKSTVSASATSNYPPYRKRKLQSNFQNRAAKMPRQSRIPNRQALFTRQRRFMTRNSSFSHNQNYYNSDTSDWRFEQSESYRVPDRRFEHSQNYREPEWRLEHSQNYRERRLCPDFNTQWDCPLTNWECPYIHDYAEDIHFS